MELKDVILSTIAELGEEPKTADKRADSVTAGTSPEKEKEEIPQNRKEDSEEPEKRAKLTLDSDFAEEEREFLKNLKERLLVLFEGFQSPNNKRVEAKIDLTLNFLEYLLAMLDERIDALKKR